MKKVRTQTKRALSVLLAVVMVVLAVPVAGFAGLEALAAAPEFDWSSMGSADGTGSADDLSNGGTQGGIIQFGAYPQTKETDSATISALNSRASGWQSYGYYSGTGNWDGQMTAKDYMMYCDVKYGGSKYRGVTFSQYRPYYTGSTSSASFSHQDDNGYTTRTTYWFKYEPLQWKVIEPSEGLAMCASLIDSQPYNNYILESGTDPHGFTAYWGDAGKNHYANDYENSSLRQWLNETFYATAFTESQQNRIAIDHNHQNNDGYCTLTGNTNYMDYDSNPTNDKIFLLSYDEVLNSSYGFSAAYSAFDTGRRAKGTDYAKCQGLYVYNGDSYNGISWWWLRSPGNDSVDACAVRYGGYAGIFSNVVGTDYGVRPACVISNLSSGNSQPQPQTTVSFSKAQFECKENETISLDGTIKSNQNVQNVTLNWSVVGANVNSVLTLPARVIQSAYTTKEATFLVYAKFPTAGTYQISVSTSAGGSATCTVVVSKEDQPEQPDGQERYLAGYEYENDKGVANYEDYVDKKIYKSLFGFCGEFLDKFVYYAKDLNKEKHGMCMGIALATGVLLAHRELINNIFIGGDENCPVGKIKFAEGSAVSRDFNLEWKDYIKYCSISQYGTEYMNFAVEHRNKISDIWSVVKKSINANHPVILSFGNNDGTEKHAVIAVGYAETSTSYIIYTDDSDVNLRPQKFEYSKILNEWTYEGTYTEGVKKYTSVNCWVTYYPVSIIDTFYQVGLILGKKSNEKLPELNTGYDLIGSEEMLSDNSLIELSSMVESTQKKISTTTNSPHWYWIPENHMVDLNATKDNQTFSIASSTIKYDITLNKGDHATVCTSSGDERLTVTGMNGKDAKVTATTTTDSEKEKAMTVSGVATSDITVYQTSAGLQVSGLKDMAVTVAIDDKVIAKAITDSDGTPAIVSIDEDSKKISVEWIDACPYCGEVHEGFFGKIIAFFHSILYRIKSLFVKE